MKSPSSQNLKMSKININYLCKELIARHDRRVRKAGDELLVDVEGRGMSVYSLHDLVRRQIKELILDEWPWLESICTSDDIPDSLVDKLIDKNIEINNKIILDKKFVDHVVYIINKFTIGHSAKVKDGGFTLIENDIYESDADRSKLKDELEDYIRDFLLLRDLTGGKNKSSRAFGNKKTRRETEF